MSRRPPHGRSALAFVLAAVLFLASAGPAFAALEDVNSGTSTTNPNEPANEDFRIADRLGWGNSLYPQFTIDAPQDSPPAIGFLYVIDRFPISIVPNNTSGLSPTPAGSLEDQTYDLQGVYDLANPLTRDTVLPGATQPIEGSWYLHLRYYSTARLASAVSTHSALIAIDLTDPEEPSGLTASGFVASPYGSNISATTRRDFSWHKREYDALSGTSYFNVYLDGEQIAWLPNLPFLPNHVSIEDLPAGRSTIEVETVDRATNKSERADYDAIVDPDVPAVSINKPYQRQWISGTYPFTVATRDAGGVRSITFKIDGVVKQTSSSNTMSYNTRALSGGHHRVTVDVKDLFGHVGTQTKDFYVDNSPIRVTSVSDSPDPFYPRYKDGYKDTTTVKCYTNENASTLYLRIWAGSKLAKEYKYTNKPAGWQYLKWDGKWANGGISEGTYYYQVVTVDHAGNVTATGKNPTTIRFWELVRLASNQWKIVQR